MEQERIPGFEWEKGQSVAYIKDYENETIYLKMPLVRLANRMIELAADGLPLTTTGNPKLAVLKELYPLGPSDWYIELHPEKQISMITCMTLAEIWDLLRACDIFRKYKSKLKLTKLGKELLGHPKQITHHLFYALATIADTAMLDAYRLYPFNDTLDTVAEALEKYGSNYETAAFYAEKYAEDNPGFEFYYKNPELKKESIRCFETRIMVRFYKWMGLVDEIEFHYDPITQTIPPSQFKTTDHQIIGVDHQFYERLCQNSKMNSSHYMPIQLHKNYPS